MGAGPHAAGPVGGGCTESAVGVGVELEAAVFENGKTAVGLDGWPDGEGAVIDQGEDEFSGLNVGTEKESEEDRERGGRKRRSHGF